MQERLQAGLDLDQPSSSNRATDILSRLGNLTAIGSPSVSLNEELAMAGYHGTSAAAIYMGAKALLLLGLMLVLLVLVLPTEITPMLKMCVIVGVPLLASFIPNAYVRNRRIARRTEIRKHLADCVDLLEICVTSGMGLDSAWNAVTDEIRRVCQPLADEMALTNLEMHLGVSRAVAMRHMAQRTGADELSSLAAMLVQSDRFGTSVSDALRVYAQSMREDRSQRAQESAEKMAVKLILPMTLFVFPAVVLVMAGPAGLAIYHMMNE